MNLPLTRPYITGKTRQPTEKPRISYPTSRRHPLSTPTIFLTWDYSSLSLSFDLGKFSPYLYFNFSTLSSLTKVKDVCKCFVDDTRIVIRYIVPFELFPIKLQPFRTLLIWWNLILIVTNSIVVIVVSSCFYYRWNHGDFHKKIKEDRLLTSIRSYK